MRDIELILLLLAVSGAVQMLARRARVPYPSLLVIGGLALAFIPGLPRIERDPGLLFFIFIPPLLYWTSITTSFSQLRDVMGSVARLSTILVLGTMAAVAVVIHAFNPQFTWGAAFLLGAIVAPPDPVAAAAVIEPLGVSREITTVLEGEGLFNDATALVAYRVALSAVLAGTFSPAHAGVSLLVSGIGGAAVGLAAGWVIAFVRRRILGRLPIVENTLSLLSPFIAYIPADALGASGVLAVVAVGLYLARQDPRIMSPASRIQGEAMWTMLTFLLESLIFILIGLELRYVLEELRTYSLASIIADVGVVTLACVLVRFAWVGASVAILRWRRRRRHKDVEPRWNEAALVAWAGMRGGDSLVIALAIPVATYSGARFPARDLIILITFGVILATLVVQGLTITPIVKRLGLHRGSADQNEELDVRVARAQAALDALEQMKKEGGLTGQIATRMYDQNAARLRRWSSRRDGDSPDTIARATGDPAVPGKGWEANAEAYNSVREKILAAERDALTRLRDGKKVDDIALRRSQRELDLESMLLDSSGSLDELGMGSPFEIIGEE